MAIMLLFIISVIPEKQEGDNYTFGLYERFDLEAVAQYTRSLYPDGIVGVHGFSMGAATSTMHTELNEEAKKCRFLCARCAISYDGECR